MSRMERILIILVGVGLVFNALTFLTVAHYFSSRDAALAAPAETRSPGRAAETPGAAETQRRLQGLETTLSSLSKKIDSLASRSTVQAGFTPGRSSRGRTGPGGRRTVAAAQDEEPETEEHEAEAPPPADPRKSGPSRSAPAPVVPGAEVQKPAPAGAPDGGAQQVPGANGEAAPPPGAKDAGVPPGGENGEAPAGGTQPPAGGAPPGTDGGSTNGGGV